MKTPLIAAAIATLLAGGIASASSHREAPNITKHPKVDGTDLYMFRSYESGREGYVTLIANYQPLQGPGYGPNYFSLEPNGAYDINIDNDGDAVADIIYRFRFNNFYRRLAIPVGGKTVEVPLQNIGPFRRSTSTNLNRIEAYTIDVITPEGATPFERATNGQTGKDTFIKPFDNLGNKSIPNYNRYANTYITPVNFPGCSQAGRVFVGQRAEGFAVNLGEVFDLVNLNPVGPRDAESNTIGDLNITSIAMEVPIQCLTAGGEPVIGAWTTAHLEVNGVMRQVSRLGNPLVNEVVIGLYDKNRFNQSSPVDDGQFATYVTNPTLPELLQILFPSVQAPNAFPREDLVSVFLTGVSGLNMPANVRASEMLRLNTSIAPVSAVNQDSLGVLAGDNAGFPNGRRPGDDVVDAALRVAMGVLLPESQAPSGQLPYTDGAIVDATDFRNTFPYLNTPHAGSPNSDNDDDDGFIATSN